MHVAVASTSECVVGVDVLYVYTLLSDKCQEGSKSQQFSSGKNFLPFATSAYL